MEPSVQEIITMTSFYDGYNKSVLLVEYVCFTRVACIPDMLQQRMLTGSLTKSETTLWALTQIITNAWVLRKIVKYQDALINLY